MLPVHSQPTGMPTPTAVQEAALEACAQSRDLVMSSQTGSGKTAAIGMALAPPLLEAAESGERPAGPLALILAPTRELAVQVQGELTWLYAEVPGPHVEVVTGGTPVGPERRRLARGPRVLVGTPGRLLDHVRSGVRALHGDVAVFQIGECAGGATPEAATYAFLLKNSALAVRAEANAAGVEVAVAQCAVSAGNLDWQRRLWAEESAAYIDVLPLVVEGDGTVGDVPAFLAETLQVPPAPTVWVHAAGSDVAESAGTALAALAQGAAVGFVDLRDSTDASRDWGWVRGAHAALGGQAPAPAGQLKLETAAGRPFAGGRILGRFFSEEDFTTLIFYTAPGEPAALPEDRLIVDSKMIRNARNVDLASGETLRVGMSATVSIDTGYERPLPAFAAAALAWLLPSE